MPSFEAGYHDWPGGTEKHQDSQSVGLDMNLPNIM
jgi:hypothetical protein